MSDTHNRLEEYLVAKLQELGDKTARKSAGSGCGNDIADVVCKDFYIEAKINATRDNIIVRYKEEWLKLLSEIPLNTHKIPMIAKENKQGDRFITIEAEDFFRLIRGLYE